MDNGGRMMFFCLILAAISCPVLTVEWKANVVKQLEALVSSCVVIPCTFTHPKEDLPTSRLRGIWHLGSDGNSKVYYQDQTQVLDNYKGRTRLLGQLGQDNCTLEMTGVRDHDNGPFCFRIELAKTETQNIEKFSFVDNCITLTMLPDPPKPTLIHPKTAFQGHPYTVTCSVTHTCPTHVPKLTWSMTTTDDMVTEVHRENRFGYWEVQSILTFTAEEKDDHTELSCTAQFHGLKTSSTKLALYVKRKEDYNHIIIPIAAVFGTALIFTVVCIFMVKRYKKRIAEIQSRDGSVLNRLSRLSYRIRSYRSGPTRSDQRRPERDTVDRSDLRTNVNSKSGGDQKVFKARFPSPKSQPKSCNYKEDLNDEGNVYGNL